MNNNYRFSPIKSKAELLITFEYLTENLEVLSQKLCGEKLPINTLKVFAHYPEEFELLTTLLKEFGPISDISSNTSFYVESDLEIKGHTIKWLGVRIADPYRSQAGCGDFWVDSFADFQKQFVGDTQEYIRIIEHPRLSMLELWHPDFDVLGYVIED